MYQPTSLQNEADNQSIYFHTWSRCDLVTLVWKNIMSVAGMHIIIMSLNNLSTCVCNATVHIALLYSNSIHCS